MEQTLNQLLTKQDEVIKTYIFLTQELQQFESVPEGYGPAYQNALSTLLKNIRTAFMDLTAIHFELMQPYN